MRSAGGSLGVLSRLKWPADDECPGELVARYWDKQRWPKPTSESFFKRTSDGEVTLSASQATATSEDLTVVTYEAGEVDFQCSEDGEVTAITKGGKAERSGVAGSWTVSKVKGQKYTKKRLDDAIAENAQFRVSFKPPGYDSHRPTLVTFEAGDVGFQCSKDGNVTEITAGGQAERSGVETSWIVSKVNGQTYSKQILDDAIAANAQFGVTFKTPKMKVFRSAALSANQGSDTGYSFSDPNHHWNA